MRLSMMRVVLIAIFCTGLSTSGAESRTEADIASRFNVRWSSVQYRKAVVVYNPEVSSAKQETSETVSLGCEVEIRDPNLVLGVSRDCTVTELTDGRGREIKVNSPPQGLGRFGRSYEGLRYSDRFAPPAKVPRWRSFLRSLLKLPQNTNVRPQRVTKLEPSRFQIQLDKRLIEQDGAEIRHIEGYFHALMAESYVHIDVPFEPNDNWVRLTPELEIQVREAHCDGSSYRLRIEALPRGGISMRPLSASGPLPDRVVIAKQFIGPDGKPTGRHHGFSHLPVPVAGSSSGGGRDMWITAIRFVIAVNPTHQKIPFELKHIPLPHLDP